MAKQILNAAKGIKGIDINTTDVYQLRNDFTISTKGLENWLKKVDKMDVDIQLDVSNIGQASALYAVLDKYNVLDNVKLVGIPQEHLADYHYPDYAIA